MNRARRRQERELARWENDIRVWAVDTGRAIAIDLYHQRVPGLRPYDVGLVLEPGEHPWVQIPVRCNLDELRVVRPGRPKRGDPAPQPPIAPWLITDRRLVGRFADGHLGGWRWDWVVGYLGNLDQGHERVHLDIYEPHHGGVQLDLYGPGVAPLAVAAVYHLHGALALLEHPSLGPLHNYLWANRRPAAARPEVNRPAS